MNNKYDIYIYIYIYISYVIYIRDMFSINSEPL